jgi:tryptophan-rich sensory protein
MKTIGVLLIFLVLNFAALGIGAWLMGGETQGTWYAGINKAPWTPPGWVFGAAWFSIMILFSLYMWVMWGKLPAEERTFMIMVYGIQWLLNVAWNPIFFKWHFVVFGLVVILLLWLVVIYLMIKGFKTYSVAGWCVLPYALWLGIATSLNAYIWLNN